MLLYGFAKSEFKVTNDVVIRFSQSNIIVLWATHIYLNYIILKDLNKQTLKGYKSELHHNAGRQELQWANMKWMAPA